MKLNTQGRYALIALVDLTRRGNKERVSLSDIASKQNISLYKDTYLRQKYVYYQNLPVRVVGKAHLCKVRLNSLCPIPVSLHDITEKDIYKWINFLSFYVMFDISLNALEYWVRPDMPANFQYLPVNLNILL